MSASERRKRYDATAKGRAKYARYRLTEGYAAAQERRRVKNMALGWPAQTAAMTRLRIDRPEVIAAHAAVATAIRTGTTQRPKLCFVCGSLKRLHGHHYLGYEPEHRLDVLWVCAKCHKGIHEGPV